MVNIDFIGLGQAGRPMGSYGLIALIAKHHSSKVFIYFQVIKHYQVKCGCNCVRQSDYLKKYK